MNGKTHILFSVLISFFFINFVSFEKYIFILLFLIFGTLLPDTDIATSTIGKKFKLFSHIMEHRGFFHSIFLPLILAGLFLIYKNNLILYLIMGVFSHLFLDSFTKKGIKPFYPLSFKIKGNIKTGSFLEILLKISIYLIAIVVLSYKLLF